jgi:putative lipoprotein
MRGLALIVALHLGGAAGRTDPWISPDKAKHFFLSAFVESVSFSAFRAANAGRGISLAGGAAVSAALGVGREIYDYYHPGTPSFKDLAWDAAGIAAAAMALHQTVP